MNVDKYTDSHLRNVVGSQTAQMTSVMFSDFRTAVENQSKLLRETAEKNASNPALKAAISKMISDAGSVKGTNTDIRATFMSIDSKLHKTYRTELKGVERGEYTLNAMLTDKSFYNRQNIARYTAMRAGGSVYRDMEDLAKRVAIRRNIAYFKKFL